MQITFSAGKAFAIGVAVLTFVGGVLTTALVITSNANQGSFNRSHDTLLGLGDRIQAIDDKVTDNKIAINTVSTQLGILIAKLESQQNRTAREDKPVRAYPALTTAFVN